MNSGSERIEERLARVEILLSALVSTRTTESDSMHLSQPVLDPEGDSIQDGEIINFRYGNHERDGDAVSSVDEALSPKENSAFDDTVDGMGLVTFADEGISGTFGNLTYAPNQSTSNRLTSSRADLQFCITRVYNRRLARDTEPSF